MVDHFFEFSSNVHERDGTLLHDACEFCADVLLKISASPYLLLLDLYAEVSSAATVATVSDEHLTFALQKVHTSELRLRH